MLDLQGISFVLKYPEPNYIYYISKNSNILQNPLFIGVFKIWKIT